MILDIGSIASSLHSLSRAEQQSGDQHERRLAYLARGTPQVAVSPEWKRGIDARRIAESVKGCRAPAYLNINGLR